MKAYVSTVIIANHGEPNDEMSSVEIVNEGSGAFFEVSDGKNKVRLNPDELFLIGDTARILYDRYKLVNPEETF